MQKYIIKQFRVGNDLFTKNERSGNYVSLNGAATCSLMDFLCLPNSSINSVERQPVVGTTRELFTIDDLLNNGERIQTIKIVMGEVKIYTPTTSYTLEAATRYIAPTPIPVETEVRRGPGRPKKSVDNTGLDPELLTIQNRIEASFNGRQLRLSGTLKKRKETPEEFLYKFFNEWNNTNSETTKITKWVDDDVTQCECGKRRSLGDLYMILKYYFPTITVKDVLVILYIKLPTRLTNGFRTSKCNQIHKRVWYYAPGSSNAIGSTDVDDEYGKRYSWYQTKIR